MGDCISKANSSPAFWIGSDTSSKLIHQSEDAFADLEQLLPRFGNRRLWQKLLWGHGFQSGLRLMQMIQRALQIGDRERGIGIALSARDSAQCSGELGARSLKLEDELIQILVCHPLEPQFVRQMP